METISLLVDVPILLILAAWSRANTGCRQCDMDFYCQEVTDVDTCCLNANVSYDLYADGVAQPRYDCVSTRLIEDQLKTIYEIPRDGFITDVWMVTQCLPNWDNIVVRELCEMQDIQENIELLVPVFYDKVHYRNKHCAECNGISEFATVSSWKAEIFCDADLSSSDRLISHVKRRKCNIFVTPPANSEIISCVKEFEISECNITVSLSKRIHAKNYMCELDRDPFELNYAKDYFCYSCDTVSHLMLHDFFCVFWSEELSPELLPPFSAILDIQAIPKYMQESETHCDPFIQIYDPITRSCRDLYCDEDRYLSKGECLLGKPANCSTHFMFVKLTPESLRQNLTDDILEQDIFLANLQALINRMTLDAEILHLQVFQTQSNTNDKQFLLIQMVLNVTLLDEDIISYLYKNIHTHSFKLMPTIQFTAEMVMYTVNPYILLTQNTPIPSDLRVDYLKSVPFRNEKVLSLPGPVCLSHIYKVRVCPLLALQLNEQTMQIENGFLTVKGNLSSVILSPWQYANASYTTVFVCLEDFIIFNGASNMSSSITGQMDAIPTINPKQMVAFICICLSIACLLITLTTYLIFSSLQSQPGINNVILCVSLLCAQTFYQFGSGQTWLPDWACAVIGAFCHFFWLTVMFSMNICSVEMYCIFKNLSKLPPRFRWLHTLRNVVYIACSSLLFVLINLIVSFAQSQGKDSGYGGSLCYLSSPILQLFTFVVPSAVTVVVNIVLFSFVVLKINTIAIGSANLNQERNYLRIYARLSSLVGLTWLFGFLQLLIKVEALEYVFIVLNASQGVFIIAAFVINRRTFSLYCKKMDTEHERPSIQK